MQDAKRKFYPVAEDLRAGRHVPKRDSVWKRSRAPVVEAE